MYLFINSLENNAYYLVGAMNTPGEGNDNPLQCSCLENPRDGEPGGLQSMESEGLKRLSSSSMNTYKICTLKP